VLARHFVANAARAAHRASPALSREALGRLEEYSWPGNVRELENAVTRAVALVRGDVISAELLSLGTSSSEMARTSTRGDDSLSGAERTHIAQVLEKTNGNKRRAATLLGVSRSRLDRLMEKHGLAPTE
jgi:Nif-specific regulatory protein